MFKQWLVKKLTPDARLPSRQSSRAAGYDLYSVEDVTIPARGVALVDTGLAMTITCDESYIRIAPRSGLAVKGITIGAGVIDRDYRASVKVVMYNLTDVPYEVALGDRIAQAIVEKIVDCDIVHVEDLDDTERAGAGFGSTGR
jgi:dUTP pyrophosphatase